MNEKKTKKVPVCDLMPTKDAKGGRHGHHGHRQLDAGGKGRHDSQERAGKYWL